MNTSKIKDQWSVMEKGGHAIVRRERPDLDTLLKCPLYAATSLTGSTHTMSELARYTGGDTGDWRLRSLAKAFIYLPVYDEYLLGRHCVTSKGGQSSVYLGVLAVSREAVRIERHLYRVDAHTREEIEDDLRRDLETIGAFLNDEVFCVEHYTDDEARPSSVDVAIGESELDKCLDRK